MEKMGTGTIPRERSQSPFFPWTYDQYQRYAVLKEFLEIFYSGKKIKVLDVGGLSPDREGRSFWLPIKHIHSGESYTIDLTFHAEKDYIQGNGEFLPFKDKSFDVVTAMDTVEHIAQENRSQFLAELCRVSCGSILLSAPFQDKNIIQAEKLLSNQIQTQYGVLQQQLKEHAEHGLPQIEALSQMLDPLTQSNTGFSYGSLQTWIFNQTIKNCFIIGKNVGKIQSLLDRWMASKFMPSEFDAPFSRHFWIGSKVLTQEDLEEGVGRVKGQLGQEGSPRHKVPRNDKEARDDMAFDISDMENLNREILDFYSREYVSALVISSGETKNLQLCLEHLLTQNVDFELEVFVWEIEGSTIDKEQIKSRFPGVKFLKTGHTNKFANNLLDALSELKGSHILFLSENILLSPDSVQTFYDRLRPSKEYGLLTPQIFDDSGKGHIWFGRNPLTKIGAGRILKLAGKGKKEKPTWIFSECLFFNRKALSGRKIKNRRLSKRNLFLWEKEKGGEEILYVPELTVTKKKGLKD